MPVLEEWNFPSSFELHLKAGRKTKLGDHRPPVSGKRHRITVGHDLGPYSFLITLIHELAHMLVYEEVQKRTAPHGQEWKRIFQRMMNPFLNQHIFPEPLLTVLGKHMKDPKASMHADANLLKTLRELEDPESISLSELPEGSHFMLDKGWQMRKGKKLRTRYRCERIGTSRVYLVNGTALIRPIKEKEG